MTEKFPSRALLKQDPVYTNCTRTITIANSLPVLNLFTGCDSKGTVKIVVASHPTIDYRQIP